MNRLCPGICTNRQRVVEEASRDGSVHVHFLLLAFEVNAGQRVGSDQGSSFIVAVINAVMVADAAGLILQLRQIQSLVVDGDSKEGELHCPRSRHPLAAARLNSVGQHMHRGQNSPSVRVGPHTLHPHFGSLRRMIGICDGRNRNKYISNPKNKSSRRNRH